MCTCCCRLFVFALLAAEAPGEYSARCARFTGALNRTGIDDCLRLIWNAAPCVRACVALSISNLPIGPDSRFRICFGGPCRMFNRSRTNQLLLYGQCYINRSNSREPLNSRWIYSISTPPPLPARVCPPSNATGSSWYAPLSIGRTNRRTLSSRADLPAIRACRDRGKRRSRLGGPSVTVRRRLVSGGCCNVVVACNVREQTACITVISGMLFRVSPSMRMRPGGGGGGELAAGWKL